MGPAQPQYKIEATPRCTTHPPGSVLIYTGPRRGVAKGWRIVAGPFHPVSHSLH